MTPGQKLARTAQQLAEAAARPGERRCEPEPGDVVRLRYADNTEELALVVSTEGDKLDSRMTIRFTDGSTETRSRGGAAVVDVLKPPRGDVFRAAMTEPAP